jgi:hypothetical protein
MLGGHANWDCDVPNGTISAWPWILTCCCFLWLPYCLHCHMAFFPGGLCVSPLPIRTQVTLDYGPTLLQFGLILISLTVSANTLFPNKATVWGTGYRVPTCLFGGTQFKLYILFPQRTPLTQRLLWRCGLLLSGFLPWKKVLERSWALGFGAASEKPWLGSFFFLFLGFELKALVLVSFE